MWRAYGLDNMYDIHDTNRRCLKFVSNAKHNNDDRERGKKDVWRQSLFIWFFFLLMMERSKAVEKWSGAARHGRIGVGQGRHTPMGRCVCIVYVTGERDAFQPLCSLAGPISIYYFIVFICKFRLKFCWYLLLLFRGLALLDVFGQSIEADDVISSATSTTTSTKRWKATMRANHACGDRLRRADPRHEHRTWTSQ